MQGISAMSMNNVEANSDSLYKTLSTYMSLNGRNFNFFGKKLKEELFTHTWQEVNDAFEKVLESEKDENKQKEMKNRFKSLEKEKFAQSQSDVNDMKVQPEQTSDKPMTDLSDTQNNDDQMPSEKIQKCIKDYILTDIDDYSDDLADYMDNKDSAKKIFDFLDKNFTKHSGKFSAKVVKLAAFTYDLHKDNPEIVKATEDLLDKLSTLSQQKYIENNKGKEYAFSKDPFLCDIKATINPEIAELLNGIAQKHVQKVLAQLEDNDKIKYLRSLSKKNGLEQYNPRTKSDEDTSNKHDSPKQTKQTGDTTMADENKLTEEQIEKLNNYKDIAQITGIDINSVTQETYKDTLEALLKAEKDSALTSAGNTSDSAVNTSDGKGKESEDKGKGGDENKPNGETKDINIDGEGKENTPNTNEGAPKAEDWIKKKIKDYQDMADGKIKGCPKLDGYDPDKNIKDGFAASFNGGRIYYKDRDNVTVSKESGLIIFETLVTEPDNRGRPVNFGPNLEHEQAVKLMAACLIHGNQLGNNIPNLTADDLRVIEIELKDRPEDLKKFQEKVGAYVQTQQQNTDTNEGAEAKTNVFDDETKKQIKEALANQYEMASMERSGKIAFTEKGETAVAVKGADCSDEDINKYNELKGKQEEDKKFLADKFVENPAEMRAIINEMIKEKTKGHTKLTDAEKNDLASIRSVQLSALRDKMAKNEKDALMEHDKRILALSGRLKEGDKAFVAGKEGKKEVKALTGDAKERFEALYADAIERALKNYRANTK